MPESEGQILSPIGDIGLSWKYTVTVKKKYVWRESDLIQIPNIGIFISFRKIDLKYLLWQNQYLENDVKIFSLLLPSAVPDGYISGKCEQGKTWEKCKNRTGGLSLSMFL